MTFLITLVTEPDELATEVQADIEDLFDNHSSYELLSISPAPNAGLTATTPSVVQQPTTQPQQNA